MLNQVILSRTAIYCASEMALAEDGGSEALAGGAFRSIGSAMAMIFAIWLLLLAMVVLTGSL